MKKLVSIFFFLSGLAGLIYEVVWARYLSLFLGNTAYAHTLVLATFMGGLALGYFFFGKIADRIQRPLYVYAWMEIAIGLSALFFVFSLDWLEAAYLSVVRLFGRGSALATAGNFFLPLPLMLIPTILMGGTLPVLSRFAVRSLLAVDREVGWLYFINSFGAFAGSLLAGLKLIPELGMELTNTAAVIINLLVGLITLFLCERWPVHDLSPTASPTTETSLEHRYTPLQIRILVWGAGLSGTAALLYEIAWIRLLSLVLGSSTYAFSFMLAGFIAGIALGSFAVARRGSAGLDPYLLFATAELGVVVSIVLTLPFYERLPFFFLRLANLFIRTPETFWIYQGLQFFICFFLMLLPTLFLGMALPLASRVAVQGLPRLGRGVGNVFASNTLGAIIGIVGAGILLPLIGIKRLIELGLLANLLVGLVVLYSSPLLARGSKGVISAAAGGLFLVYLHLSPPWDQRTISSGVFRMRVDVSALSYEAFKKNFQEQVLYYKDGANMTVAVTQGNDNRLVLKVNGKSDASSRGDLPTQVLLGQLPLLLKPDARQVLVIGLGSGITAGSVLRHPVIGTDVVEISPEVVEASRWFAAHNYEPLKDPRLRLHVEDAKAYLKIAPESYDIIISEPSNPWVAGIGSLYSREFYRDARARLAPRGLMIQWIHAYEMTDEILQLVLRTFGASFEHVTLWNTDYTDLILIGGREPLIVDFAKSAARLKQNRVADDLRRVGVEAFSTLLSLQVASDGGVRKAAGKGSLNEDLFPILEYQAPKAFFLGQTSGLPASMDERRYPARRSNLFFTRYLEQHSLTLPEARNLADYHLTHASLGRWDLAAALADYWARRAPGDIEARWAVVRAEEKRGRLEAARRELEALLKLDPNRRDYLEAAYRLEYQFYAGQKFLFNAQGPEKVLGYLHRLLEREPAQKDRLYRMIGEFYTAERDYPNALLYLEKAAHHTLRNPGAFPADALLAQAAAVALEAGDREKSEAYARQALEHNGKNGAARTLLEQMSKRLE